MSSCIEKEFLIITDIEEKHIIELRNSAQYQFIKDKISNFQNYIYHLRKTTGGPLAAIGINDLSEKNINKALNIGIKRENGYMLTEGSLFKLSRNYYANETDMMNDIIDYFDGKYMYEHDLPIYTIILINEKDKNFFQRIEMFFREIIFDLINWEENYESINNFLEKNIQKLSDCEKEYITKHLHYIFSQTDKRILKRFERDWLGDNIVTLPGF